MPRPTFRMAPLRGFGAVFGSVLLVMTPAARAVEPEGAKLFREKIVPVLAAECYRCHSAKAEKLRGGLRLDSRAGLLAGGDSGPVVVAGKSDESPLIQALRHEGGLEMPPKKPKLPEAMIADFVKWVNIGAPDPREERDASGPPTIEEARRHWAFQPVKKPDMPTVRDADWVRTPIDAFVLAKLEERGWSPAPPADRAAWLRRVSFDLTGLPPTPEEIDTYL